MGIPFKGASKGVKDTDKARDEIFTFIHFVKELHDDTADSLKKAVEQGIRCRRIVKIGVLILTFG